MAWFRHKPVPLEARQYLGYNFNEIVDWVEGTDLTDYRMWNPQESNGHSDQLHLCVNGDGYNMRAKPGDWVVKGANGQFRVYNTDIFEKTYELAEDKAKKHLVDAIQFTGENRDDVAKWLYLRGRRDVTTTASFYDGYPYIIKISSGHLTAVCGQWFIKTDDGLICIASDEEFRKKYEPLAK